MITNNRKMTPPNAPEMTSLSLFKYECYYHTVTLYSKHHDEDHHHCFHYLYHSQYIVSLQYIGTGRSQFSNNHEHQDLGKETSTQLVMGKVSAAAHHLMHGLQIKIRNY